MKLYGKNPVLERLKTNPKTIRRILIEEGHPESLYVFKKGNQHHIPVSKVPYSKIQRLAQNVNTQGIVAEIEDFGYTDLNELIEHAIAKKRTLIFLDNLTDPQNLGGIIRTAGSLGGFDIVLPSSDAVGVTESVLRVACGGENYLQIARVSNLANAIAKAKDAGFWILGTAVKDAKALNETRMQFPVGLVLGSEEKGIREVIRKKLDCEVIIPMLQERMSLNVAHACSIFCFEITRQRP
jgi:23S rRNA (guanosine2251-2'-O)-methyltransferase